jgi:hypothetical protein
MAGFVRAGLFVLALSTASTLLFPPQARVWGRAQPGCDKKCRQRAVFYGCNATTNACVKTTMPTCGFCFFAGLCVDNNDGYDPLKQNCTSFFPGGPIQMPAYYFDGCEQVCPCSDPSAPQTVEATGDGSTTMRVIDQMLCIR